MVNYAIEQDAEKAAWDVWIAAYPGFTEDTFVPFSEFKKKTKQPTKTVKSNKEIENEMIEIVNQFEQGKRGETR